MPDMNQYRNLSISVAAFVDHTRSSGENLFAARHELKDSNSGSVERQARTAVQSLGLVWG